MSNVDVARRCIEALADRDVETLIALSAEDVEIVPLRAIVEDTRYRGRDGIEQWIADIAESWAELEIDLESVEEVAPGSVVALATLHGRGHGSDAPTSMPVALTARVRDGLVMHAATHADREAALREAAAERPD